MPQGRPGAWAALVAITDLEAIDARFTGEIAQRRAERENGSAIILLRRVGYLGGNAKGPDLIGRTQVEQAIGGLARQADGRSEEHTSELQSLLRTSYAVFCLKKQTNSNRP